ncbi:MAG: hypothetical protein AAB733_04485 [Patescibacteria group bacterium]
MIFQRIIASLLLFVVLLTGFAGRLSPVFAADEAGSEDTPVVTCETGPILPPCTCSGDCNIDDFVLLFVRGANFFLSLLAIGALLMFGWGGFTMIMSRGNSTTIQEGKKVLTSTLMGVFFALISWILINTIVLFFTYDPILPNGTPNPDAFEGTLFPTVNDGKRWWEFWEDSNLKTACDFSGDPDLSSRSWTCVDPNKLPPGEVQSRKCISDGSDDPCISSGYSCCAL